MYLSGGELLWETYSLVCKEKINLSEFKNPSKQPPKKKKKSACKVHLVMYNWYILQNCYLCKEITRPRTLYLLNQWLGEKFLQNLNLQSEKTRGLELEVCLSGDTLAEQRG